MAEAEAANAERSERRDVQIVTYNLVNKMDDELYAFNLMNALLTDNLHLFTLKKIPGQ